MKTRAQAEPERIAGKASLGEFAAWLLRAFPECFVALFLFVTGMMIGYAIARPDTQGEAVDVPAIEQDVALEEAGGPVPF
jgi:hypothetical protein